MIDTKKINEKIAQNILSEAEYIYENYGEDAFVEYVESLTEDQKTIVEESDHWSTYFVPGANLYQNAKRGKTGFNMDTAKAAGWDALNAASAIPIVRGARTAIAGWKAGKAATAAATSSNAAVPRSAAAIKPPATAAAPSTLTKIPKKKSKAPATTPPAKPAVDPMAAKMATPTKPAVSPVAAGMASAASKGADDAINAAKGVVSAGKTTAGQRAAAIVGGAAVGAAAGVLQNKSNKDAADALKPTPNEQGRMAAAKAVPTAAPTTGDTRPQELGPTASTKPVGPPGSRQQMSPGDSTPTTKDTKPAAPTQKTAPAPKKEKPASVPPAPKKQKSDTGGVPSMQSQLDTHGTAMGRYGKEAQKSMFREEKTSLADFRMLQERIMRKSNGSF